MNSNKSVKWAPEKTAELVRHVKAGLSFDETARLMGISKNAVVGRANRMELRSAKQADGPNTPHTKALTYRVVRPQPRDKIGCRFIAGDVLEQFALGKTYDQIICGRPVKELGAPYCTDHHAICWLAPPKRNNKPFTDLQSRPIDLQSRPDAESALPKGRKAA